MPTYLPREFHATYSNIRIHFVDLGSRHSLGHGLGNPSGERAILLAIDEFLAPGDLEFPVLLDERECVYSFVGERDAVYGRAYVCGLRSGHRLLSETVTVLYGGTNVDNNFPRCLNHLVNRDGLGWWVSVCEL